jgi:hypothetical protein
MFSNNKIKLIKLSKTFISYCFFPIPNHFRVIPSQKVDIYEKKSFYLKIFIKNYIITSNSNLFINEKYAWKKVVEI